MQTASDVDPLNATVDVAASEILILDADTKADLNLFGTTDDSLYDFCNRCRTEGGQKVLRRRMAAPWATEQRIRATQEAIAFIKEHRTAFAELPSAYVSKNVERYSSTGLPVIPHKNSIEFTLSAFSLWANEDRFYLKITQGVQVTYRLLASLRRFVAKTAGKEGMGELTPLIDEMASLLDRPNLDSVRDYEGGTWFWTKLRVDQAYRLHEKITIKKLLELSYELDALVSLAEVTEEHDYVLPRIAGGRVSIDAENVFHPFLQDAVGNPVSLDHERRVLFLTGPNMAGKTTYLRAVATALYFAHLGMGVPADSFCFTPVQCLLTSISVSDNLNEGVSYFRAEALRVKAVAQAVADGYKTIAVMDEPFKGTNVKDAFDASLAVLKRFSDSDDCLFMVSSHLIELREELSNSRSIDYQYFEAEEQADQLYFDYLLHPGVSSQRLGMRVLEEEGVFDLLDGRTILGS